VRGLSGQQAKAVYVVARVAGWSEDDNREIAEFLEEIAAYVRRGRLAGLSFDEIEDDIAERYRDFAADVEIALEDMAHGAPRAVVMIRPVDG
jgi:hypothetical protein